MAGGGPESETLHVPLTDRTSVTIGLLEESGPVPVESGAETTVEESIVLVRRLPAIDEAGAGSVGVAEFLPVGHGGGGELVPLHLLLLFKLSDVNTSPDLEDDNDNEDHGGETSDDYSDDE